MPAGFLLSVIIMHNRKMKEQRIKRKVLRDMSDPMDVPDTVFISFYRLNKEAFLSALSDIEPHLVRSSIPAKIQLAAALRFLGVGSFQGVIANDVNICLGRSTFCKILWKVVNALEQYVCPKWIKLEMSEEEVASSKNYFFRKNGMPGVIGCIDGTFVKIIKPTSDESLYFNRKGYFALNVMIICDNNMRIRAVDACRPGSCHDAFVWRLSEARSYYRELHQRNGQNGWLLGDSGYGLEPFLMTPYKDPRFGTKQHRFNQKHTSARNIVERTIGNLKSRFRCLQQGSLHYQPSKVVKIINVCTALHNVCKHFNVHLNEEGGLTNDEHDVETSETSSDNAISVRDRIADSL